jgi:starvation-inducible DNA-binding protein
MSKILTQLKICLANAYALYLKTQNYHWNVKGPHFFSFHGLFEEFYKDLAENVDELAERIVTLGEKAPGSFKEYLGLITISEASDKSLSSKEMLMELAESFQAIVMIFKEALDSATEAKDAATEDMLTTLIAAYEKKAWMIKAHLS